MSHRQFRGRQFRGRHFYQRFLAGLSSAVVWVYGGIFRRFNYLYRVLRRSSYQKRIIKRDTHLKRVFKRNPVMPNINITKLAKTVDEVIMYIFDFSNFPELIEGETISSPVVTASGLTLGSPAVITTKTDGVPANQGVQIEVSDGVDGNTYDIECLVTTSGGSVRAVKGQITVEQ